MTVGETWQSCQDITAARKQTLSYNLDIIIM